MKDAIKLIAYGIAFFALIASANRANYKSQLKTEKENKVQVNANCPSSRLEIKTLTDSASNYLSDRRLDVQEILKLKAPSPPPYLTRTKHEFYKCQVNCYVKSYKETEYGYLVKIQGYDDSTALMNAHILNPDCEQAKKSVYLPYYKSAYIAFNGYAAAKKLNLKSGCYKIIGTLLYDESGVSIFPILQIVKFR